MSTKRETRIKWFWAIAGFVAIGALATTVKPQPPASFKFDPSYGNIANSSEGCWLAQWAVRERLKAPSTAKFPDCYAQRHDDDTRRVMVTVDAQNSFGAMIRGRYVVIVGRNHIVSIWQVQ